MRGAAAATTPTTQNTEYKFVVWADPKKENESRGQARLIGWKRARAGWHAGRVFIISLELTYVAIINLGRKCLRGKAAF